MDGFLSLYTDEFQGYLENNNKRNVWKIKFSSRNYFRTKYMVVGGLDTNCPVLQRLQS